MKLFKKITALLLTVAVFFSFSACCLKHEWKEPDCTTPKTCSKCGKTEGEPLGHKWTEADCTTPKTCSVCGATEGEPLGHKFSEWEPVSSKTIGGKEKRVCSVCEEKETRNAPRNEPQKKDVLTNDGVQMTVREFAEYLIDYLPEGCYITDLYDDGFNIQGDAYATVTFDKKGNYKDSIYFYGTSISGEEDLIFLTPYLAKAIDPYADESAYTKAQEDIRSGFRNGTGGVYGSSSDLKTITCILLYVPSINDHPMLGFSTKKFARG